MSNALTADSQGRAAYYVRSRGAGGRFLPDGEHRKPATQARRRRRTERDYLRRVVEVFGEDDVEQIVQAIKADAIDGDVKVRAAAREWIGKYILGGGRVPLDDIDRLPAIIRRRRS